MQPEPAIPTVALRRGRLVIVTSSPTVRARLLAAGAIEREPTVFEISRKGRP